MFTKRELRNFLETISPRAKFFKFDFASEENFSVELKCEVAIDGAVDYYNHKVGEWVQMFSEFTASGWIVRHTYRKLRRLAFRKQFVCHRASFNKKSKTVGDEKNRNQHCRAKIDFRVKLTNRNTKRNDPYLKQGLNMNILIDFEHTHKVRSSKAFNLLKSNTDTDQLIYEYFAKGYSPTVTRNYHELTIVQKYGDKSSDYLSNANINPPLRHILYLHEKKYRESGKPVHRLDEQIAARKNVLEPSGFTLQYDGGIVCIITPTMKNIITEFGIKIILIDSTTMSHGPIITYLYVPTKLGSLPIACIIHSKKHEANYNQAFVIVKNALENECSCSFKPNIILTNNYEAMKTDLRLIFSSPVILTMRSSLESSVWCWICKDENKIEKNKRHILMTMFTAMLKANNTEDAKIKHTTLLESESVRSAENVIEYVNNIWQQHDDWLLDNNLNNVFVDAMIRFNKEFFLRICKSFKPWVVVDVITNILEKHQCLLLIEQAKSNNCTALFTKFLPKANFDMDSDELQQIDEYTFRLEDRPQPRTYINFRTDTWFCDCVAGTRAQFCEHLCRILCLTEGNLLKTPELSNDDVRQFVRVTGDYLGTTEEQLKKQSDDERDIDAIEPTANPTTPQEYDGEEFNNDDYFCGEVKAEKPDSNDPLENIDNGDNDSDNCPILEVIKNKSEGKTSKEQYKTTLKDLNAEFRRLNKFFSENPNAANMKTIARLTKELSKIRPVERVNLKNLVLHANEDTCSNSD